VLIVVQKLCQPAAGVNAKVLVTLGADVQVVFEVFFPDDLPAILTLHPQPFGANFLFARSIQLTGLSLEPRHTIIGRWSLVVGERRTAKDQRRSVLDSPLRHHALLIGMFHLAHFGYSVSNFNNCRM